MIDVVVFTLILSINVFAANSENFAAEVVILYGDMSIEEGATPGIPAADEVENARKLIEMQSWLSRRLSGPTYMSLNVPTYEQINSYYCGSATVQQTIKFYKGTSPTQESIASRLVTTTGHDRSSSACFLNK